MNVRNTKRKLSNIAIRFRGSIRSTETHPESDGFYDNIPIMVKGWKLSENSEGQISFSKVADDMNEEVDIQIKSCEGGWRVEKILQKANAGFTICPSAGISNNDTERARACWHAVQFMKGISLTNKEQFSMAYRMSARPPPRELQEEAEKRGISINTETQEVNLYEDDAFFVDKEPRTMNPFEKYIEK